MTKTPLQPIFLDRVGMARFKANVIIRYLVDAKLVTWDQIMALPGVPEEDLEQFAMLMGYSLVGFGELPYVSADTYDRAEAEAELLRKEVPDAS